MVAIENWCFCPAWKATGSVLCHTGWKNQSQREFLLHLICIIWTSYQTMRPKEKHCHLFIQGPKVKKKKNLLKIWILSKLLKCFCSPTSKLKQIKMFLHSTHVAGIWPTASRPMWSWDQGLISCVIEAYFYLISLNRIK